MKKLILFLILSLLWVAPLAALAKDNQDITGAINKEFKKTLTYYKDHSAEILDSLTTSAEVTEGDTKQTKNVKVVLAEGKEVRDSIFYFDAKQIYYYDLDDRKIIDSASITENAQIKNFVKKHKDEIGKQINPFSFAIFMIALFITIIVPPVFGTLFNKNSSSLSYRLQFERADTGIYRN
ncbi:hypothetical protein GK107_00940 [Geobacillus thermoleovorans]|nr:MULTISPECIES: hypothetical protein [Geobacillus]OQP04047.1 hypothetical protein B1690_16795 [Geobacillus sp. 46C-IIa]PJW16261.1 hypothetical protein CV944_15470 [Geobacillus sp. WSUCF-018B]QNU27742.1 hypothetical protein IC803_16225 [Geobacillus sp. 46C-IIa]UPT58208.1 hypothetical protein GK107_00940 [Geobacillus thermoleovorans]